MLQNIKKRTEGFTIIEVLIVLAIAGLIMLIVFLAVPALQRNSRNTEIRNEASRLATSANEFVTNANGVVPVAADVPAIQTSAGLSRISGVTFGAGTTAARAARLVAPGTCAGTTATATGAQARQVAIQFGLEGGQTGCVSI